MNWVALSWSGFIATAMAAAFFWVGRSFNLTRLSPPLDLGCLVIPDPKRPITETVGFFLIFLLGSTLGPLAFAAVLQLWGGPAWIGGLVIGGFAGLLLAAALPVYGTISACVRRGSIPPPGPFGIDWGRATPGIIFAGIMIYGAVFAAVYSSF